MKTQLIKICVDFASFKLMRYVWNITAIILHFLYTIMSSSSITFLLLGLRMITWSVCFHERGHQPASLMSHLPFLANKYHAESGSCSVDALPRQVVRGGVRFVYSFSVIREIAQKIKQYRYMWIVVFWIVMPCCLVVCYQSDFFPEDGDSKFLQTLMTTFRTVWHRNTEDQNRLRCR
jgi:hypothetical protein